MEPYAEPIPAWQRWLLADHPRLSHFMVGAGALLLPVAARALGPGWILPAMAVAAVVGGGLGIGWTLTRGWPWLRRKPVIAIGVLVMALACLGHLTVMPRWEVMLRAHQAITDAGRWLETPADQRSTLPPTYDSGERGERFVAVADPGGAPHAVLLYTPQALTRWTPFGRQDSCYVVLRRDGEARVLRSRSDLDAALAARGTAP
jgi:hypothetical protein